MLDQMNQIFRNKENKTVLIEYTNQNDRPEDLIGVLMCIKLQKLQNLVCIILYATQMICNIFRISL